MIRHLICAFLFAVICPSAGSADFVRAGECAIIVASRQSLPESFQYISVNGIDPTAIYQSKNGWYAISIGVILNSGSRDFVASLAERGSVPGDAYCSRGEAYVSIAWRKQSGSASPPSMQTASFLDKPFDARPLSNKEKRFLQAGLSLEGTYSGLIDGDWGVGTQRAYETYLGRVGLADANRSAAALAIKTAESIEADGWTNLYMASINATVHYPERSMRASYNAQNGTTNIDSHDGSVVVRFLYGDLKDTVNFHIGMRRDEDNWGPLYESQSDDYIASGSKTGNLYSYARSLRDPATGRWITILIINDLDDKTNRPALIAAGFQVGRAASFDAPENGHLMSLITGLIAEYSAQNEDEDVARQDAPAVSVKPSTKRFSASGSGFYINADAAIMTNAHVVKDCDKLDVEGEIMRVVASSEPFDLAILTPVVTRSAEQFLSFAPKPARLNSDITVAGFPLQSILSGLNITRGSISSMEGLEDATNMQITAPVQPGNSGGPIVDRYGRVVGVVVARLNYEYTRRVSGADPQSINFGIRGGIAELFAGLNDVEINRTNTVVEIAPEDLGDILRSTTVMINCEGFEIE